MAPATFMFWGGAGAMAVGRTGIALKSLVAAHA